MAITDLTRKRKHLHGFLGSTEPAARDVLENVILRKPEVQVDNRNLGGRTAKDTHKRKTKAQGLAELKALRKKQDARAKLAMEKERLRIRNKNK